MQAPTTGLLDVTLLFAVALAFSLVIERVLEVLKALYDVADSWRDWHVRWTYYTDRLRVLLERRIRIFRFLRPDALAPYLNRFHEMMLNKPTGQDGEVLVLSGDLVRAVWVRLACRAVGVALGVLITIQLSPQLDVIAIWQREAGMPNFLAELWPVDQQWFRNIVTGTMVGMGSGVVHKVIATIERRRDDRRKEQAYGMAR